ncbi:helix-turn-helix transcriptional regulator [Microbacterium sp. zg.B96]|uniref:helix-turn-helix transcriptional regulator n=1 Tax=Microbacterium sp. zg.B96 TaxID=2969409 RepID=UPI00214AAE25|nr:LuxR family transcriptional regulator [Microbacterium sp. zg.B96]MCR2784774.1 LuxR C-terminal-related transcriptional regulator [Microbacterium sp. zg.B96]
MIARLSRRDRWPEVLPRLSDLTAEGVAAAADFQALSPELRAHVLALALQGVAGVVPLDPAAASATGFVDVERGGLITWSSDVHRVAVLAGADLDDHRVAGRLCFSGPSDRHGGALHLLLARETVEPTDLVAAADFFARADRPSWAMVCLVSAADAAPTPTAAASFAAAAANIAAFEGDFSEAERVMRNFTPSDTKVLIRDSAPARALRQALVETNTVAARATVLARLEEPGITASAAGQALAVYALANIIDGDPTSWEGFFRAFSAAPSPAHPAFVAIVRTIGAPNTAFEPHLDPPVTDGRGWSQLAECMSSLLDAFRDMRLEYSAPAVLGARAGNRLVRTVAATWVSVTLAHNHHWSMLDTELKVAMDTTSIVPAPLMRLNAEALFALLEAFRGERAAARERLDRIRSEPALRRAYRLRLVLDSVDVMIEGPQGNYEHALALLSTREPDILDLTVGPCGPVEIFDFVDYALLLQQHEEAVARVEQAREILRPHHSERAAFVLAACEAAIAARNTLTPAEDLLARAQTLPFVYECARLRLVYAERLRRLSRTAEARRQLLRVEVEFKTVQAGAWMDRVHSELRACQRGAVMHVADLTEQESRIAELAAGGLSNKEIGTRLHLSPRTVGGHLYKVFPKLGITTRAQLRDALVTANLHDTTEG